MLYIHSTHINTILTWPFFSSDPPLYSLYRYVSKSHRSYPRNGHNDQSIGVQWFRLRRKWLGILSRQRFQRIWQIGSIENAGQNHPTVAFLDQQYTHYWHIDCNTRNTLTIDYHHRMLTHQLSRLSIWPTHLWLFFNRRWRMEREDLVPMIEGVQTTKVTRPPCHEPSIYYPSLTPLVLMIEDVKTTKVTDPLTWTINTLIPLPNTHSPTTSYTPSTTLSCTPFLPNTHPCTPPSWWGLNNRKQSWFRLVEKFQSIRWRGCVG